MERRLRNGEMKEKDMKRGLQKQPRKLEREGDI